MSVRAGQIVHDAEGLVIARIQTAGVTNMNFPQEKVYELGNFNTVGILRDTPDLSFDLDSQEMNCETEALICNADPLSIMDGQLFDFANSRPLDIISPFRVGQNLYTVVNGVIVPYLTLETVSYKFGLQATAGQTFTLRGDSVYYTPGSPYYQTYALSGAGPYAFAHAANIYRETGVVQYANSICYEAPDGTFGRLTFGQHYTDTTNNFTLTAAGVALIPASSTLKATYGSLVAATYAKTVNDRTAPPLRPIGVRSRDIDIYIGTNAATPVFTRVEGVQSFNVDRKVNLDKDEEFGNSHYVSQDYDTADVTGQMQVKPGNVAAMFTLIRKLANVSANETVGVLGPVQLPVEIRLLDPSDHNIRLKTLYVPDAVFNPPPVQGRVQTKLTIPFDFTSEGGTLLVYKGDRAGT